jgi:hypothetical protein
MISLENLQSKPIFACKSPNLNDHLPLNMTAPDQVLCKRDSLDKSIAVADAHVNQMAEYWLYAQAAQAAYLLHIVIEWILDEAAPLKPKQIEAEKLDNSIQSFTVSLLQQPRILEFDGCGPYSICVR